MNNDDCFDLMHNRRVSAIFTSLESVCKHKERLAPIFTVTDKCNDTIYIVWLWISINGSNSKTTK